jgi:hypothetical protein
VGFTRRLVRKSVRKATPRSVRRAMHPVRTVRYAVTPRPVRQVSRALYTVTNPLGAAENAVIGSMLNAGSGRRRTATRGSSPGRQTMTVAVSGVRAAEAVEVHDRLARLMAVQRDRFAPATQPILAATLPVDASGIAAAEWARRKREAHFWRIGARKQIRRECTASAAAEASRRFQEAQEERERQQEAADQWWNALTAGDGPTVTAALKAAFADNVAPVSVEQCDGSDVTLVLTLPGIDVLPRKRAHITPSGRLSSKQWTKTELNDVYADLIGAHLLATLREAWAVAPSIERVRVVGARPSETGAEILFDVDNVRTVGRWDDDDFGSIVLEDSEWGLHRIGRTREVGGWPASKLRSDISVHA